MSVNQKDLGAGIVFLLVAALYGGTAWRSLPIGHTLSMGPGYFPLVLSALIALVGLVLVVRSLMSGASDPVAGPFSWRALLLISGAIILFGAFLREIGMFVGVAGVAFLSALASREFRPIPAALLALGLGAFCALVFGYGVKLPLPILGSWFGG